MTAEWAAVANSRDAKGGLNSARGALTPEIHSVTHDWNVEANEFIPSGTSAYPNNFSWNVYAPVFVPRDRRPVCDRPVLARRVVAHTSDMCSVNIYGSSEGDSVANMGPSPDEFCNGSPDDEGFCRPCAVCRDSVCDNDDNLVKQYYSSGQTVFKQVDHQAAICVSNCGDFQKRTDCVFHKSLLLHCEEIVPFCLKRVKGHKSCVKFRSNFPPQCHNPQLSRCGRRETMDYPSLNGSNFIHPSNIVFVCLFGV